MTLTESKILALGGIAPNFHLQDSVTERYMTLDDIRSDVATVVMFICNHCPYVIHVNQEIIRIANEYRSKGVAFVAISSNDVDAFPEDAPDKMNIVAKVLKFPYPYLFDKRQETARAYDAVCTPDFYVFDQNLKLTYHGRLDDSRPGNGQPVTGSDLRNALDLTIQGLPITSQYPSLGCSIKWKSIM